ncbi:hypothetical protein HPB48_019034 [Haemaphysalis longicornis]|uniref:DDE Tnp4 domain-containing protein n=1 Tax=Haemaphysalis longicornis TaxID=44386 RepID=A0A9J6GJH2_HAELO|nr:hypothetical protein HPB48_019034 [Haemaphysalis longicornis]
MYVARNGMLNIEGMPATTFRRQFRFEKADFEVLVRALEMPDIVTSAQGVRVAGTEALCMCLSRLAYPNRLCDLQEYFGRHYSVISSITNKVMLRLETQFGVLLDDLTAHPWLTTAHLKDMSDLDGPYPGSRHDAGIPRESELYEKLEAVVQGHRYVIYGDPAYPLRPLLMKPYGGALVTRAEESFNKAMSTVRKAVEWGFGRISAEFAFLDLKKTRKSCCKLCPECIGWPRC